MSSPTNPAYFANLTAQINACDACPELQKLATEAMTTINATIADIHKQIAALAPLLVVPTDLPSVITWVKSMIAQLQGPSNTYVAQLVAIVQAATALVGALEAAAGRLTNCQINVPPVVP